MTDRRKATHNFTLQRVDPAPKVQNRGHDRGDWMGQLVDTCSDHRQTGLQAMARGIERRSIALAFHRADGRLLRFHCLQRSSPKLGIRRHERDHGAEWPSRLSDHEASPQTGRERGEESILTSTGFLTVPMTVCGLRSLASRAAVRMMTIGLCPASLLSRFSGRQLIMDNGQWTMDNAH